MIRHIVVAGGGTVGLRAIFELQRLAATRLTLIDSDPEQIRHIEGELGAKVTTLEGDALEDHVLMAAGVHEASGFVAALANDRDNLFLSLAVRQLNPEIRVVSRIDDEANTAKFLTVGANEVVGAATMGGRRLAHALLRPEMAGFADALMGSEDREVLLRELTIQAESPVARLRLASAGLAERTGCIVLGIRTSARGFYIYHPSAKTRLKPKGGILALGTRTELETLAGLLNGPAVGPTDEADLGH